ncbi:putative phenol 2-monooxygenase [Teratosphaeria nubilosa]|uniref:Putative phenol 2-monooxygenase n=1 Tax=Teratosphaeria nubilosa TaxID=161662 RepID=A0A6G1LKE6_9PEZI|nr:putative phenol 2-monooxygenase [Teratosphaeria nubilosa]
MAISNKKVTSVTSETDVLVVGGGPAGLIAAWWMARTGIRVRVIDKDPHPLLHGRADGMRSRTVEMLDSMGSGMQETVTRESFPMLLSSNWMRNEKDEIQRIEQMPMYEDHTQVLVTPFCPQALSQGRLERIIQGGLLDVSGGSVVVERGIEATKLDYNAEIEDDPLAYPITVGLRKADPNESANSRFEGELKILNKSTVAAAPNGIHVGPLGNHAQTNGHVAHNDMPEALDAVEEVRAKYLVGCDGARSWLRKQLNIKTDGSHTNTVWAALDIFPITDFPDVRRPNGVQTEKGTLMLIPREKGLLRIYVPFGKEGKDATREGVTLEQARDLVQKAFKPYHFTWEHCQWWSSYSLGQRYSERAAHPGNRIFLSGDAVHNNSPLIGLGLNVSAQDAWNLGWKIALAVKAPKGMDRHALMATYESERLPVAEKLVWYDRNWTTLFNKKLVEPGVIMQRYFEFRNFSDAFVLGYPESPLAAKKLSSQAAAPMMQVGESFKHTRIAMHADAQTYWTCNRLRSDGRFHLILFAGDWSVPRQMSRVETFCRQLIEKDAKSGDSLLYGRYPYCFDSSFNNYDRSGADCGRPNSMINFVTLHCSKEEPRPTLELPEAMRGPYHPVFGWDSTRVWIDRDVPYDRYCDGRAYEAYGVDSTKGCVAVLRPDMHIGYVGGLEDFDGLVKFFQGVFGASWRS